MAPNEEVKYKSGQIVRRSKRMKFNRLKNDYKTKYWQRKGEKLKLHFRNPSLRLKLNVVMSTERLIAFQLTRKNHKAEDVAKFILGAVCKEQNTYKNDV